MKLSVLLIIVLFQLCHAQFSFLSIGDWGCMGIGRKYAENQIIVAKQFTNTAKTLDAKFVLNVGDNFYYCGVTDTNDPAFNSTFENV